MLLMGGIVKLYNSKLYDVIFLQDRERKFVEEMKVGSVILPIIKLYNYDVYIYGYNEDVLSIIAFLNCYGIEVKAVIETEKNPVVIRDNIDKIPIIPVSEIENIFSDKKAFVFINLSKVYSAKYKGFMLKIFNKLQTIAIKVKTFRIIQAIKSKNYYVITNREKIQIYAYSHIWTDAGRIEYYVTHYNDIAKVYNLLSDDISRETMVEYIRAYMQSGIYHLAQCDGKVKYFCGHLLKDSKECYESLYIKKKDEVWLNCGSNIGDSIFLYFANGFDADTIFAFEGDKKTYKKLCSNLLLLPINMRNKVVAVNEFICGTTNFVRIFKDKKVSLVNADIEGCELELLLSLKDIIIRDRPVLAICAYHKASDLVDFTDFINSITIDYEIVLRKYFADFNDKGQTAEIVWYAIPRERYTEEYMNLK